MASLKKVGLRPSTSSGQSQGASSRAIKKKMFTFDALNDTIPRWTVESDRQRLFFLSPVDEIYFTLGRASMIKKTCSGVGILERAPGLLKKQAPLFDTYRLKAYIFFWSELQPFFFFGARFAFLIPRKANLAPKQGNHRSFIFLPTNKALLSKHREK